MHLQVIIQGENSQSQRLHIVFHLFNIMVMTNIQKIENRSVVAGVTEAARAAGGKGVWL